MELQYVVTEKHDGQQLKGVVKGRREFSSSLWKRIKWTGEILVNGVPVHNARMVLHAGDTIIFRWSEDNDIVPSDIPLSIIYEDKDILIVNKGPGMIIHPTSREAHDTLVNAVAGYFHRSGEDAGIHPVYRLDRNTTGLVVVAKSAWGSTVFQKAMIPYIGNIWPWWKERLNHLRDLLFAPLAVSREALWNGWFGKTGNGQVRSIEYWLIPRKSVC